MCSVIGEVLASFGVGKDCQSATIERQKLSDVAESVSWHGELNASARVGADGAQVEVADGDREARLDRCRELLGELNVFRIVVNVGVEIADAGLGHRCAIA